MAAICNQKLIDFRVPQADNSNHELQLAHETLRMYQSLEKAADLSSKLLLIERETQNYEEVIYCTKSSPSVWEEDKQVSGCNIQQLNYDKERQEVLTVECCVVVYA